MTEKPGLQRNSGRCKLCGDELVSTHRHDFVTCSCHTVSIDGGFAYLRRVWDGSKGDLADVFEDTSICNHEWSEFMPDQCLPCGASRDVS